VIENSRSAANDAYTSRVFALKTEPGSPQSSGQKFFLV
jgi:hypothetical protein